MDDAAVLGAGQRGEDALEHAGGLRERERADVGPQRPARDVLHRDVADAVTLEEVEHGDDVRVRERAGEARLAQEAAHDGRVARLRVQFLQRHPAVEIRLPREVDDGHPAAPELAADLVAVRDLGVSRLVRIESHSPEDPAQAGPDTSQRGEQMQARTCRRLVAAATVAAATASRPGARRDLAAVDHRSQPDDHLGSSTAAAAACGSRRRTRSTRSPAARCTLQRNVPGTNFNAIAFNPAGTVGIAVGDAGAFYRFNGSTWVAQPALKTYNYPYDSCPSSASGPYTLTSLDRPRPDARALGRPGHGLHPLRAHGLPDAL